MQCPVCTNTQLVMSERSGIEIDYCPQCRGVWLDRGELDKIIDRAAPASAPGRQDPRQPQAQPYAQPHPHSQPHPNQAQHHGQPQPGYYYKKKKREGFLGELFDFD